MTTMKSLRVIWWALLGILLIGFAIMDGFDLGTAALLPFVARNDIERRIAINTVGPVWEGNQVWFILGGGAIFAAWPALYAASFSGFYLAMFLVLATLILRPVGFKFRSKLEIRAGARSGTGRCSPAALCRRWCSASPSAICSKACRSASMTICGCIPRSRLLSLLNPFALLVGLVSLSMIVLHGAAWLNLKTDGAVQAARPRVIPFAALVFAILFALAGLWLSHLHGLSRLPGRLRMTGRPIP